MPYDGSGNFSPTSADNPVVSGTVIEAAKFNNTIEDLADGLTAVITRDGQGKATADLSPATDATYNLGSDAKRWANAIVSTGVGIDQGTYRGTLGAETLTANRTWTLPDSDLNLGVLEAANVVPDSDFQFSWDAGTTSPPGGGWTFFGSGPSAGVYTEGRVADAPTFVQAGRPITYCYEHAMTTGAGSPATAGDYASMRLRIEGPWALPLIQKGFTIGFWCKCSQASVTIPFAARNLVDRTYISNISITASATWEFKTISVPALTTGTWDYSEGATGLDLQWLFLYSSTAGNQTTDTWLTSHVTVPRNSSATNLFEYAGVGTRYFRITGVVINPGSTLAPYTQRPFDVIRNRLMRYYQKSFAYGTAPAQNAGLSTGEESWHGLGAGATFSSLKVIFPVTMAGTPTMTTYNPSAANSAIRDTTVPADCTGTATTFVTNRGFVVHGTPNAGHVAGGQLSVHWRAVYTLPL